MEIYSVAMAQLKGINAVGLRRQRRTVGNPNVLRLLFTSVGDHRFIN